MTWTYDQSTGDLFHDGEHVGTGYSGKGRKLAEGRNNPDLQHVRNVGPIPGRHWRIGNAENHPTTGPLSIRLTPKTGTNTFGRAGFLIHGNNSANDASTGCIIMARGIREEILASDDKDLEVVA
jgi:Protein of unknown function (DUF2778)